MSESESGASPSTKKSGNYKIPLILGAIGLLLMISPFFYSAYVDATVGRGGPDDVSSGWAFVWALYHLTPPGLILLGLAFIIGFAQTLSYISSRSLCVAEPGSVRLTRHAARCGEGANASRASRP